MYKLGLDFEIIKSLICFSRKKHYDSPDGHQIKAVKGQIKAEMFAVSH